MPPLSQRRRILVLAICCMSLLLATMDNTIVNVALPSIRTDLHASISGLQWTVDAYMLVLASLLIVAGSTADRIGRRRTFQTGLVLFTAGSLLCSLAPGLGWLIAFRMLQAIGGCMLNPVAMSIISNVFPEPRERARAIGVWGAVIGISMGLGPIVGGALTESVGWRAIFWVNVPIGLAALVLTRLFVPESKAPRARRLDPVGQLLVIVAFAAVTYAIIEAPQAGWASAQTVGLFALAAAGVAALVAYERRRHEPLIELRFFRSVPFSGATAIAVCSFSAFAGLLFVITLYLQDVRGMSPLRAGIYLLPLAILLALAAPLSGRMVGTRGARLPIALSGVGMCVSALLLVDLGTDTSYALLLACFVLFGAGFGLINVPITNTAMAGMPRSQAGVAAAVASTSRQIGSVLGVAVAGSLINSGTGNPSGADLAAASHPVWWIMAGCGAAVVVLGAVTTGRWARRTAARTAHLLDDDASVPATVAA